MLSMNKFLIKSDIPTDWLIKFLILFHSVLLSANYVSRYFKTDGGEIIAKNEVCSSKSQNKFN